MDALLEYFRELLILKTGAETLSESFEDHLQKKEAVQFLNQEEIIRRIQILFDFKEKLQANTNLKLTLTVLWDQLSEKAHAR